MTKRFTGVVALDDVDLEIGPGSVHALLGGNGSGKSTLIKALAGIFPADAGQVSLAGRTHRAPDMTPRLARSGGLRFVHQQLPVFPDLTVAENLAIGHGWVAGASRRIRWREQYRRASELLDRFGIQADPRWPLALCSLATQTMVTVARAMQDLDEAGVLVLDEPTSAFPPAQVDLLLGFVRNFVTQGHSVVYVTHRLDEVVQVAEQATILRDGRVEATLRGDQLTHDRLSRAIMGPTAESALAAWRKSQSTAAPVAVVERLTGGPVVDASFELRPGEIVGLAGLLGSGRSTLLKMMFGVLPATAGTMTIDDAPIVHDSPRTAMRAGVAYIPEDRNRDAAFAAMSVTENLGLAATKEHFRRGRIDQRAELASARRLMDEFRIKAPSVKAAMATLSGGNQQKVVLARWLRRNPKMILLDEPTQGVDVGARAEIWQLIRKAVHAGACALVATSDLEELAMFCDRALVVRGGRIVAEVESADMTEHHLQTQAFGLEEAS
jgi:ribose transport system ATP-binding protein